jgi:Fe-S cluster assembly ATP-binding protein
MASLDIRDLHVEVEGREVVKGVTLSIKQGEIHALMGPNGSGKSSLAFAVMGHPKYRVVSGDILINGKSILDLTPDERAKRGLFLAFQHPVAVSGVSMGNFLRSALNARREGGKPFSIIEFRKRLTERVQALGFSRDFVNRYLNEGFSGGEKKKSEVLQLAILRPQFAILDEIDSGLDIDSLKLVANEVNQLVGPDLGVLLVTHYQRILKYIRPTRLHVMIDGVIKRSGGYELAELLEARGYGWVAKMGS